MYKSVGAILIYKKNFLLQKRDNFNFIRLPSFWGCFGGEKKKNETYVNAIKREIYEEINLKIDFKKHITTIYAKNTQDNEILKRYYFVKILNTKDVNKIQLNEGQKYAFFNIEKIINLKKIVEIDLLMITSLANLNKMI